MIHVRLYILASLTFGMALALLSHFASLLIFGEFLIAEPNKLILSLETICMFIILIFGSYCLIEQLKGRAM